MYRSSTIGVVIPACNEEQSVGAVVRDLLSLSGHDRQQLIDDIVVCDNGSEDATAEVARQAGARVVVENKRGYGRACQAAIAELDNVDVVLFVDADNSVDINETRTLLDRLKHDVSLVIGVRVPEKRESNAMTTAQRIGNDISTGLIRFLWNQPVHDLGPFRAIKRDALVKLDMSSKTYGWTVEMQVKAIQLGLRIEEVPTRCLRRIGVSKISGTLRGVVGAGVGIIGTILFLFFRECLGRKEHRFQGAKSPLSGLERWPRR